MIHLNTTLKYELLPLLLFQLEVYFKVHRLLTGLTAQKSVATNRCGIQIKHLYNSFVKFKYYLFMLIVHNVKKDARIQEILLNFILHKNLLFVC